MSKTRKIEQTISVRADRQAVWKALTDGEQISRWFAPEVRTTPGAGGKMVVSWGPGMEVEQRISIWEPPTHLQLGSDPHPETHLAVAVDYFLEGEGGTTTVRLVHSGFSADAKWDEEYDATRRGWALFLRNLRHCLERHPGKACVQNPFMVPLAKGREEVWPRVLEALGFESKAREPKEGDPFRLSRAGLDGTLELFSPARDIAGVVPALDDGLFRLSVEKGMLYGVLLTYGVAAERPRQLAAKLTEALQTAVA